MERLRVVTYNIHKCRGLDRRVKPQRIAAVLKELNGDIIGLQEVLSIQHSRREADQARFIAEELGLNWEMGENRKLRGGAYGNVLLSRFPLHAACNYNLSVRGREERGCMRTDVMVDRRVLHVFNAHLGTAFFERRHQGRRLVAPEVLSSADFRGPRIVMGDFNEWTRGLASKLLAMHLESADVRLHLSRSRTYPGVFPFMHLDHIYYDAALKLERLGLHRTRLALIASDHLPLYADFTWPAAP